MVTTNELAQELEGSKAMKNEALEMLKNKIKRRLQKAKQSKTLDLSSCRLTYDFLQRCIVPFLKQHPDIIDVTLKHNAIGDEGAELLSTLSLKSLDLTNCNLTEKAAKVLALNKTLKILNLSSNDIKAAGGQAFVTNTSLLDLDVSYCNVSDEVAKELILNNNSLLALNLAGNHLASTTMQALATPKRLRSLNVSGNRIENSGLQAFVGTSLKTLIARHCGIEDIDVKHFSENDTMLELDLRENPIPEEKLTALQQMIAIRRMKAYQESQTAFHLGTDPKMGNGCPILNLYLNKVNIDAQKSKELFNKIFEYVGPIPFKLKGGPLKISP